MFVDNSEEIARAAMDEIDSGLSDKYALVIRFLASHPASASKMRGKTPVVGSSDYIRKQAHVFFNSRKAREPKPPQTVPDEMVSVILVSYFDIPKADAERVRREHLLSMGAENLVGDLLERYLASVMEPKGWIWCSGAMLKAVDFIKPPDSYGKDWTLLQVKNRDNSENSSSSAIRGGTTIKKWYRTFSKKGGSNWGKFPDASLRPLLSEEDFKSFVREYLKKLRDSRDG